MQKIHFLNKTQDYSITIPMQFPILRLFILKDDIVQLNNIISLNKLRKKQFFKPTYNTMRTFSLYRKLKNNVCIQDKLIKI